jgi:hypothetical protein
MAKKWKLFQQVSGRSLTDLKDKKLEFSLKTPFNLVVEYAESENWQALVNRLRTVWSQVSSFDSERLQQFLNSQPSLNFC